MAVMADFSTAQRKSLAAQGMALPDGSYPIRNKSDLQNAIQASGRAGSDAEQKKVRRFIIKRARALDLASLVPQHWNSDGTTKPSK